jgi:hypothetical protein
MHARAMLEEGLRHGAADAGGARGHQHAQALGGKIHGDG